MLVSGVQQSDSIIHIHERKKVLVAESYPILCNPMDCSPPGSSVHGIFQARPLEWVAIPFSREASQPGIEPGSPTLQVDSLPSEPPRNFTYVSPFLDSYSNRPLQSIE